MCDPPSMAEASSEIDVDFDQLCSETADALDSSWSAISVNFESLTPPQPTTSSPKPKLLDSSWSSISVDFDSLQTERSEVSTPVRKKSFCNHDEGKSKCK